MSEDTCLHCGASLPAGYGYEVCFGRDIGDCRDGTAARAEKAEAKLAELSEDVAMLASVEMSMANWRDRAKEAEAELARLHDQKQTLAGETLRLSTVLAIRCKELAERERALEEATRLISGFSGQTDESSDLDECIALVVGVLAADAGEETQMHLGSYLEWLKNRASSSPSN